MQVLITDRRLSDPSIWDRLPDGDPYAAYPDRDPYREAVEAAGGELTHSRAETESAFVEECRDADVIVTFKAPFPERVLAEIGETALLMRNGVGFDNIAVEAATEHGIPVSNVPGNCNDDVASHALALMLAAAHELVEHDRALAETGELNRRAINQPYGGTCGIVGLGRIGRSLVPKVRGLGMDVIAYDPYLDDDIFAELDVESVPFEELLARSDAVSVHAPLTAETRHRFSTDEFETMRETAVLVNTARGPIVDEAALVEAVERGDIWSAGLDVFESEPPADSPVLDTDGIVCTPHSAGVSPAAERRAIEIGSEEVLRVFRGEHPRHLVNPEVFQRSETLLNPEANRWGN